MLWLIGMMGAGKSTVGRLVAAETGLAFVDLDEVAESLAGMPVSEVFASVGETGFRRHESAALRRVMAGESAVVATGGGVVLDPDNVARMRSTGTVVWLQATVPALAERTEGDVDRPLLEAGDRAQRLADLLAARLASYSAAADATVATDDRSPSDVAEEVGRLWLAS